MPSKGKGRPRTTYHPELEEEAKYGEFSSQSMQKTKAISKPSKLVSAKANNKGKQTLNTKQPIHNNETESEDYEPSDYSSDHETIGHVTQLKVDRLAKLPPPKSPSARALWEKSVIIPAKAKEDLKKEKKKQKVTSILKSSLITEQHQTNKKVRINPINTSSLADVEYEEDEETDSDVEMFDHVVPSSQQEMSVTQIKPQGQGLFTSPGKLEAPQDIAMSVQPLSKRSIKVVVIPHMLAGKTLGQAQDAIIASIGQEQFDFHVKFITNLLKNAKKGVNTKSIKLSEFTTTNLLDQDYDKNPLLQDSMSKVILQTGAFKLLDLQMRNIITTQDEQATTQDAINEVLLNRPTPSINDTEQMKAITNVFQQTIDIKLKGMTSQISSIQETADMAMSTITSNLITKPVYNGSDESMEILLFDDRLKSLENKGASLGMITRIDKVELGLVATNKKVGLAEENIVTIFDKHNKLDDQVMNLGDKHNALDDKVTELVGEFTNVTNKIQDKFNNDYQDMCNRVSATELGVETNAANIKAVGNNCIKIDTRRKEQFVELKKTFQQLQQSFITFAKVQDDGCEDEDEEMDEEEGKQPEKIKKQSPITVANQDESIKITNYSLVAQQAAAMPASIYSQSIVSPEILQQAADRHNQSRSSSK